MKIIIRSPNWIGDCIMCLPAVRALKAANPGDEIVVAGKAHLEAVFQRIPEIAAFIPLDSADTLAALRKNLKTLRTLHAGAALLFTNSFYSALLFKFAGIPDLYGYRKEGRRFLLSRSLPFRDHPPQHQIDFYLALTRLYIETRYNPTQAEQIFSRHYPETMATGEDEKQQARARLREMGVSDGPLLAVAPSAAHGTAKEWLPERFAALIDRALEELGDLHVLLFGAAGEREKNERIRQMTKGDRNRIHNIAGINLRESFALLSVCSLFAGNDSGLMHAASSLRIPLAAIFGPTPLHKAAPLPAYNPRVRILHHPQTCAPCKHRNCPIPGRPCMAAVSTDETWNALKDLYESSQPQ